MFRGESNGSPKGFQAWLFNAEEQFKGDTERTKNTPEKNFTQGKETRTNTHEGGRARLSNVPKEHITRTP